VAGASQYFEPDPHVASRPRTVDLVLPDSTLHLQTDRGVFSAAAVDPGTKLLLLESGAPPSGSVDLLDLGCGYGPIALTLARRSPDATVWAIDVNRRALDLCAANATTNGVQNVRAVAPDDVAFAGIYSNPPIRSGKAALHELLLRWLPRLLPDGRAYLVVAKNLGSDSLQRWLSDEQGFPTTRLASERGYRVLEVAPAP